MTKPSPLYSFIQNFFKYVRYALLATGLGVFALMFAMYRFASSGLESAPPTPPDKMVLELKLTGPILAAQQQSFFDNFLDLSGSRGIWIPKVRNQVLKVIDDDRVQGVFISLENLQGSFAQIEELSQLLQALVAAGKHVHIWSASFDTRSYVLASAGSTIQMPSVGSLQLTDPTIQLTYFGSALKKLGVGVNVIRAGQYKSAFEAWTHDQPTTESRTMYQALEKSLRSSLVQLTAKNRQAEPSKVEAWLADSLFTAQDALDNNIIDGLSYETEALVAMEETYTAERYSWKDYHRSAHGLQDFASLGASATPGIAWIEAAGSITMTSSKQGGEITPHLKKELDWAKEDENVKAVVLRIDSPGGSAVASDLIWKSIEQLNKVKPVIVSMGGVAASGGYYLSAPATKIFASATTITGSIGVIGMIPWFQGTTNKYGVSFHTITSGHRKSLLNPGQSLSRSDREKIQNSVSTTYELFLDRVSKGRSMERDAVHQIAQGRVWTGAQALENGLVDELGGIHEALAEAKTLAGWDAKEKVPLHRWSPKFDNLSDCLSDSANPMKCFPVTPEPSSEVSLSLFDSLQNSFQWFESLQKDFLQARMSPLNF